MLNFGSGGIKKRGAYQFTKLCSKEMPSDMNVVHRGYQMVIGTRGDVDIDFADVARYEEYEDANGTHTLLLKKGSIRLSIQKAFMLIRNMYLLKAMQRYLSPF